MSPEAMASRWARQLKNAVVSWLRARRRPSYEELMLEYERAMEQALAAGRTPGSAR